jgi:DNA-binding transcriptional LysR family regulator
MDLNEVAVFVKVVHAGSFSRAARQLGMPNSTVSSKVSTLEQRLGVTLLQRTTRKLHLTAAGERYLDRCKGSIAAIEAADSEMAAIQREPQGLLRVTAMVELGDSVLPAIVSKYLAKYPKVSVELIFTDRRVDLLSEGVDVAIRAGTLQDSTLIAKKIGMGYFSLYAAPKYLRAHGTPTAPRELRQHHCIHFSAIGAAVWDLRSIKERAKVAVPSRVGSNSLAFSRALCLAGEGIAILPALLCQADVRARKLQPVLPGWHSNAAPIHFVYPAQRFVTPQLSAFIAMATETLRASFAG